MAKWDRVSRAAPCPICNKHDWCLVAPDKSVVICCRVESDKAAGNSQGWLHQIRDDGWERPQWRAPKRVEPTPAPVEMRKVAVVSCRAIKPDSVGWLSRNLGVSVDSLLRLRVGWKIDRQSFTFPMREPNGNVCGIRYRTYDGTKFSELGSRDGMFFRPDDLRDDYLIVVEGASDTAAMMDLGFYSVVGRAACRANTEQIVTLLRRKRPKRIIIIPDNDDPGRTGAEALRVNIELAGGIAKVLTLPDGVKDVRQALQKKEIADRLRDQIGELCSIQTTRKESSDHDNDIYI